MGAAGTNRPDLGDRGRIPLGISASPSGPRKMDRTVLGLRVVAKVGLDMPCSPA
jgi:hypothetical protein